MGRAVLTLVLVAGCTRTEDVVCASDEDCSEAYYCDLQRHRCLRRTCESDKNCIEEFFCDLEQMRCVPREGDAGSHCDQDSDGVDGPQCKGADCDDDDGTRFPGNDETCNGQDDDCDDTTLEGTDSDDDDFCASGGPLPCCAQVEDDCCDTDADAKPGQVAYFTMETDCGGFDFDCSGTEEVQFTGFGGCTCNDPNCSQTPGWSGAEPSCGGPGDRVSGCTGEPCSATCTPMTTSVAQGCR